MKEKKPVIRPTHGILLPGERANAHVYWSTASDGPMNLIGKEFPVAEKPWEAPAGDNERLANRAAFLAQFKLAPHDTAIPKLVHGSDVFYVTEHNDYLEDLECDGTVTDRRKFALTTAFADCPSVVLFDGTERLMTVLHAGWKGIAAGIIEEGLSVITALGAARSDLKAFIGPSVRRCCYEVGPEVATQVDGLSHQGHVRLDLPELIVMRLIARGVSAENIWQETACTSCATVDSRGTKKPLYFSYRREKQADPLNAGMLLAWMS